MSHSNLLFITNGTDLSKELEHLLKEKHHLTQSFHEAIRPSEMHASACIDSSDHFDAIVEFVGLPEDISPAFENRGSYFSPEWVQRHRPGISHLLITTDFIKPSDIRQNNAPSFKVVDGNADLHEISELLEAMLN